MILDCSDAPARLRDWRGPGLAAAVAGMLGTAPMRVTLDRAHFPGNRPVQLALTAHLAPGRALPLLAEHIPDDPQAHADAVRASLGKSRNGQKAGLGPASVTVARDLGLVLRQPGLDERLPGLRLLHDPAFARATLAALLGPLPGPVSATLVAHRLGKRAVLRLTAGDRVVYARLRPIKSRDGETRLARHRALWDSLSDAEAGLRIPQPLGALPEIGLSVFGVLPGDPPDFGPRDCDAIARALATLQGLDPEGLPHHSGADEARLLRDWLDRCRLWRPGIAERVAPGLAPILAALDGLHSPPRPCHRDLHEKQILTGGGLAGLLDFDTLCLSDPALDPGNLLAHLFLAGRDEAPLRARLDSPALALWRSAALYRLAMIYAPTSTPDAVLHRLIQEARRHAPD